MIIVRGDQRGDRHLIKSNAELIKVLFKEDPQAGWILDLAPLMGEYYFVSC